MGGIRGGFRRLCVEGGGILSPEFIFDKLIRIVELLKPLFCFKIGESSNICIVFVRVIYSAQLSKLYFRFSC